MAASNPSSFTLSLHPHLQSDSADSLKDVIGRISTQRGGFRHLTEESLQQEIVEDTQVEDVATEPETQDEEKGTVRYIATKRAEMLAHLSAGLNETLMALDMVALLQSKYNPKHGELGISPALKQHVPLGTLAYDIWEMPLRDEAQMEEDNLVKMGWKIKSLKSASDSLLSSAERLKSDVQREVKYWEHLLSVSQHGWPIYQRPGDLRTMLVKFGPSEAGPIFERRGVAVLRPSGDGSIILDQGLAQPPKTLRVRVKQGNHIKGTSKIQTSLSPSSDEVTLEQHVHRARDSLFEEELFHEMVGEAREQELQSIGVRYQQGILHLPIHLNEDLVCDDEILVDLVPLDSSPARIGDTAKDPLAQYVATALRLLLSHSYRLRLLRRSQLPPPLTVEPRPVPPSSIVRPVMVHLRHSAALKQLRSYLTDITRVLDSAGFPVSLSIQGTTNGSGTMSLTKLEELLATIKPHSTPNLIMHDLVEALSQPLKTSATLTLPSSTHGLESGARMDAYIGVDVITHLGAKPFGTEYVVSVPTSLLDTVYKQGNSASAVFRKQMTFSTCPEIIAYANNILSLDLVYEVLASKFKEYDTFGGLPQLLRTGQRRGEAVSVRCLVHVTKDALKLSTREMDTEVGRDALDRSTRRVEGTESRAYRWDGHAARPSLLDTFKRLNAQFDTPS